MIRKLLLVACLVLPLIMFAQEQTNANTKQEESGFGLGGAVGSITVGNQTYSQVRLMPEIIFWKIGIGLDIDLLIDKEGNVRKEDWDEAEDYLNKIYYVRFAQRGDPFYFKVGGFPSYTLGHGLIVNGYSNMLQYPQERQIGLMVGVNTPLSGLGVEGFSSNLNKNEILAGRVFATPLEYSAMPLLKKLQVGASFATDRNQYGYIKHKKFDSDGDGVINNEDMDADGDNWLDNSDFVHQAYPGITPDALDPDFPNIQVPDEKEDLSIVGLDYELPLIESSVLYLSHYGEAAQIVDHNMGFIFPGFYGRFLIFEAKLEMRHFQDEFLPGYFDQLYDDQRAFVIGNSIETKEMLLEAAKAATGWYGSLTSNLFNVLSLNIAYQDMYGSDVKTGKSLWGSLSLTPTFMPMLKEAKISYQQTNVEKISDWKTPSALVSGRVAYGMSANTDLVAKYQERYVDINSDGKIKGDEETEKTFGFGVEFKF